MTAHPLLIGLSGYARSGKDTVGQILQDDHGLRTASFAATLKRITAQVNPYVTESGLHLADLLALYPEQGWEGVKQIPEVRRFLQALGVACRDHIHPDVWVDALFHHLDPFFTPGYVITDVRFPNEADAIRKRGGEVWRITRPNTPPANDHPSETALDDYPHFSRRIRNDGTLHDLRRNVLDSASAHAV